MDKIVLLPGNNTDIDNNNDTDDSADNGWQAGHKTMNSLTHMAFRLRNVSL